MFPSAGLFANTNCPFTKHGLCERPHCFYKHGTELDVFGDCKSSIVDLTGDQNDYPYDLAVSVNDDTKDDCRKQLERLNKEIETVRHEVEQEQRRLSHYQTVQADSRNTLPRSSVSRSKTTGKNIDKDALSTSFKKTNSCTRKYVVDNSKPRTDLEYDPLSNFSAGLRSYSSSGKGKDCKSLKRGRNAVHCVEKETVDCQAPDRLDGSYEDCQLIIDVPSSPDKKRGKAKDHCDSVLDKEKEFKETKASPILLDSPPLQHLKTEVTSPLASKLKENNVQNNCGKSQSLSSFHESKECENVCINGSGIDFTKCLEEEESKEISNLKTPVTQVEKSPKPAGPPATTDQHNQNLNYLVVKKVPQSANKMYPLQPCYYQSKNSLFYKAPEVHTEVQNRHHVTQSTTTEQPAQNMIGDHWSSTNILPTQQLHSQKTSKILAQEKTFVNHSSLERSLDPVEPASGCSQAQAQHSSSASRLTNKVESPHATTEQPSGTDYNKEVIIIESSSDDDELNYSDIELSDSDPMEECYRIFMEANVEDKESVEHCDDSVRAINVEEQTLNVKPSAMAGRKRVAHEVKHIESAAKSRPQPQVLVPLCGPAVSGFAPQPSITTKIQQVQQRASILTASVKGSQAFVSSTCQRKTETQSVSSLPTQTPENLLSAAVQNAAMNYIPLGTAMIDMGSNVHLILPEGTFPLSVTSSSSQVTSVLTPITQVYTSPVTVKQAYNPPLLNPVQRYRTTAPVLIPAQVRKPTFNSTSALAHPSPVSCAPQSAASSTAKTVPSKRKLKQQSEPPKDKVPHAIRQRYVNMFTEEFLKTSANVNEAFEKALAEEKTLYNRSINKIKYQSVVVNALKRLKNQSAAVAKYQTEVNSQRSKGNIPLNLKKFEGNDDMPFYESLKDYILTEERLIENNYPVKHPEKPGYAVLFADSKKVNTDSCKRVCCRCGATYSVSQTGKHVRKEECVYHYGKGVTNRVPGGVETRYSCCEGVMGAPGCQVFQLHVHDSLSMDGFVSTIPRKPSDRSRPGVYSLDCEMCYTIHGLELSRVTVVNSSLQVIYDTFVRPDNEVIDYNTRFSGISENDVKDNHTSLREVQKVLLSFIKADTILIGHGLETDLCALKLLHGTVVDTSVIFPHCLGPPHKLTLNSLTAEYLRRIIQESVCGHDTAEDAVACMELMLWKLKEDGKLKK
ncbi:RNA exonuclease 1 homolog isoform X2 [Cheilinus undulatus]|uniref:RNA exonuclease 1 homolog isoform X2 n=1 Tax=Cheilinus undulatus TaxID=241271 RepID=UPI001BD2F447|nr:RNA exonuclease 1 homolog isoform X2 [Cheilinus undulatus]